MDHLKIFEKLCENTFEIFNRDTAIYYYSAAIYESWLIPTSSELEKRLANKLNIIWHYNLNNLITYDYKFNKEKDPKLNFKEFAEKWLNYKKYIYREHVGLIATLHKIENDINIILANQSNLSKDLVLQVE
jgi:hypothetical protein